MWSGGVCPFLSSHISWRWLNIWSLPRKIHIWTFIHPDCIKAKYSYFAENKIWLFILISKDLSASVFTVISFPPVFFRKKTAHPQFELSYCSSQVLSPPGYRSYPPPLLLLSYLGFLSLVKLLDTSFYLLVHHSHSLLLSSLSSST